MNDTKLRQLTAFASFGFALFCMLWVILNYSLLPVTDDYALLVKDSGWIYVSVSGLLSAILGIFAVFGIFHDSRDKGGMLLFIGAVILVLGLMVEMSSLTWDTFIWPAICSSDQYVSYVNSGLFVETIQFKIFMICLLSFLFIGNILFAIGLMKTRSYGLLIPLLLIVGIVLYAVGNFTLIHIASAGLVVYCAAMVMIGIRLFQKKV
jgi:hypothetical protein